MACKAGLSRVNVAHEYQEDFQRRAQRRVALVTTGILALTLLIGGCGFKENRISRTEEAAIVRDAVARIGMRPAAFGMGASRCVQYFSFGQGEIRDTRISDGSGTVRVIVPVSATGGMMLGGIPTQMCFGLSNADWSVGTQRNIGFECNIERWESGWRLSTTQGRTC